MAQAMEERLRQLALPAVTLKDRDQLPSEEDRHARQMQCEREPNWSIAWYFSPPLAAGEIRFFRVEIMLKDGTTLEAVVQPPMSCCVGDLPPGPGASVVRRAAFTRWPFSVNGQQLCLEIRPLHQIHAPNGKDRYPAKVDRAIRKSIGGYRIGDYVCRGCAVNYYAPSSTSEPHLEVGAFVSPRLACE